jgi:hypothetical protein
VVVVLAAIVWHAWQEGQGIAERTTRLSTLLALRQGLTEYAKQHGTYPPDLEPVRGCVWSPAELDRVVYVAQNAPYVASDDIRLFYENPAATYGPVRGWYDVYEYHHYFRIESPEP